MALRQYIKKYGTTDLVKELVFRSGIRSGQIIIKIFSDGKQFEVENIERFRSSEDMKDMDLNIESIVNDVIERRERKRLRRQAVPEILDTLEHPNLKNVNAELRARGFRPFRTIEAAVREANARPLPSLEFRKP